MGLGLWAQSAADVRPPRAPASAPDTAAAGKDPWIRRAVTGELPGPHAPSALLELSSLDPGLGARAQDERRAASIARGSRRTRSEKRSGWDSASVGHLVCLVQACVKGLYLYLYLLVVTCVLPRLFDGSLEAVLLYGVLGVLQCRASLVHKRAHPA